MLNIDKTNETILKKRFGQPKLIKLLMMIIVEMYMNHHINNHL